jgi:hypothetical protein
MDEPLVCYITDDRHTVKTLAFLVGADEDAARAFALKDLAGNRHHLAVEVWRDSECLFVVTRADLDRPGRRGPGPDADAPN